MLKKFPTWRSCSWCSPAASTGVPLGLPRPSQASVCPSLQWTDGPPEAALSPWGSSCATLSAWPTLGPCQLGPAEDAEDEAPARLSLPGGGAGRRGTAAGVWGRVRLGPGVGDPVTWRPRSCSLGSAGQGAWPPVPRPSPPSRHLLTQASWTGSPRRCSGWAAWSCSTQCRGASSRGCTSLATSTKVGDGGGGGLLTSVHPVTSSPVSTHS